MAAKEGSAEGNTPMYYIRAEDLGLAVNPEYMTLDLVEVKKESELQQTCDANADNTNATSTSTQEAGTPIILQFVDVMPFANVINAWNSTPSLVQSGQEAEEVRVYPAKRKIKFLGCSKDAPAPIEEGQVECSTCTVRFKSQKELNAHMQLHQIRKCGMCDVSFKTPAELHGHLEIHLKGLLQTNQQSVNCSEDAADLDKKECSNVTLNSIDQLRVKCSMCPDRFGSREQLIAHMQCHKIGMCDICSVKFTSSEDLQEHLKIHAKSQCQTDQQPTEEKRSDVVSTSIDGFPIKCSACPARFRSQKLFDAHMEFHKNYNCSVCEANFVSSAELQEHLKSHMKSLFRANQQLKNCGLNAPISLHQGCSEEALLLIGKFRLKCRICSARFKCEQSLIAHMQLHGTSKCSVCEDKFETPAELQKHLQIHVKTLYQTNQQLLSSYKEVQKMMKRKCATTESPSEESEVSPVPQVKPDATATVLNQFPFECSKCPARFASQKSLDSHMLLHGSHKCSTCEARFETSAELNEHVKTHVTEPVESSEGEPMQTEEECSDTASTLTAALPFKCNKCFAAFGTRRGLNAHKQVHPVHGTCGVCGIGFKNPTGLLEHLKIHLQGLPQPKKHLLNSGGSVPKLPEERFDDEEHVVVSEVPFECHNCSARFGSQRSLNAHMTLHRSRECSVCSLRFDTVIKRQEHMKIHHENSPSKPNEATPARAEKKSSDVASTPLFYECGMCLNRFKSQLSLNAHKQLHTSRECGLCWERFETPAELHYHLRKHMRGQSVIFPQVELHPCPYCEFVFTTNRRLFFHLKEHPEKATYDCSKCHLAFFTVEEFAEHKMCHGLISCNLCDAKFRIRSELDAHNQLHDREKPFACKLCIKRYHSKNELTRHMRTHSKDKPYSCSFCPAKFRQPSAVKEHEMLHKSEKKLGCAHCPARFYRKTALKYHLKVHSYLEFSKEKMVEEIQAKPHHCTSCFARFSSQTSLRRHERNKSCDKPQSVRNRRPPPVEQVGSV